MKIVIKSLLLLLLSLVIQQPLLSQSDTRTCAHESIMTMMQSNNTHAIDELIANEISLQKILTDLRQQGFPKNTDTFTIPVVLHIFHDGDNGKIDMDQALSGIKILNEDINGLGEEWNNISERFDSIKGKMNIRFIPAQKDPNGEPTNGIIYHEDPAAMLHQNDLFQYAWDNFKYLNIYLPKYTKGAPSQTTAYAFYPSITNTENNGDGIIYSSVRWGYGNQSELEEDDDWASIITHEVGHWLNLFHIFHNGCSESGDFVDDTPPAISSGIQLSGCDNNDFSCGEPTNGENFMDYNHRCKKMFTRGQVERMTAALYLPSRINLWSEPNLIETGLIDTAAATTFPNEIITSSDEVDEEIKIKFYPNPAKDFIIIESNETPRMIDLYNTCGQLIKSTSGANKRIDLSGIKSGLYYYRIGFSDGMRTGRLVVE